MLIHVFCLVCGEDGQVSCSQQTGKTWKTCPHQSQRPEIQESRRLTHVKELVRFMTELSRSAIALAFTVVKDSLEEASCDQKKNKGKEETSDEAHENTFWSMRSDFIYRHQKYSDQNCTSQKNKHSLDVMRQTGTRTDKASAHVDRLLECLRNGLEGQYS